MVFGTPPHLSKIKTWGATCYAFEEDNPALHDRAIKCKLLGFVGKDVHAYRLLNCSTGRIIVRYNIILMNHLFLNPQQPVDLWLLTSVTPLLLCLMMTL